MPDFGSVARSFGAQRAVLTRANGLTEEAAGTGGGLVASVESMGVGSIVALLAEGDQVELHDTGVALILVRETADARMRVSWDNGPTYEERIPLPVGSTPAPVPAAGSPAPAAPATGSDRALFDPAPDSEVADLAAALHDVETPLFVTDGGVFTRGTFGVGQPLKATIPAVGPGSLGAPGFRVAHGVRAAYVSGAMAGGIGSPEIVIAMGHAGLLGFYGAGGLPLEAVTESVKQIKAELGDKPAGFNLLHNPNEPQVEQKTVDLYLEQGCRAVSASAFMQLTPAIVRYRLHGIHADASGRVVCPNKVFAKVSRAEVAEPFMRPAPEKIVAQLVSDGHLTAEQAELAKTVPMAEDITGEADSGGHTDRRPLVVLLPTLQRLRAKVMAEEGYADRGIAIRIGAAGGVGDPGSAYAALAMGADYLLTGSINQSSVEAGTSVLAKEMVAQAGMADVATGPAPDMFELGAHVQVLSRGSMYAQRAGRLYDLYKRYPSMEAIPDKDRAKVEKTILQRSMEEVWEGTRAYWAERDPREVEKAESDSRHKMALTFRWYLGMTSRWARIGDKDRKRDFQIWCGPSMGSFNDWVRGTWLEPLDARHVVDIADALLGATAGLRRVELARAAGVVIPPGAENPPPTRKS